MHWIIWIILCGSGLLISYQDLSTRRISVWLIVAFALTNGFLIQSFSALFENMVFCICYLLFLYLVLLLYFYIKTRQLKKVADTYVGWGDILIVLAIGIALEPELLIYFFSAALIISLILSLVFVRKSKQIPLAGFLVLNYLVFTGVSFFFGLRAINLLISRIY